MGNLLFSLDKAFNICGAIVIRCQGSADIFEVKHELGKVINTHSYIEIRIEQGSVSAPFNTQFVGERFCHIRHDLH